MTNWNWFSFVVGLLIGWLVEWIIDWVYWRRRGAGVSESETSLRAELTTAKNALDKAKGDAGSAQKVCQDRIDQLNQELLALRAEKDSLSQKVGEFDGRSRAEFDQHTADLSTARGEIDRLNGDLGSARIEIDDLRAQLAAAHSTAAATLDDAHSEITLLRAQLDSAAAVSVAASEPQIDIATPVFEEHVELDPLATRFDADFEMPAVEVIEAAPVVEAPTRSSGRDDLTIVEGIGPKIAGLLRQANIHTFAELADASQERLHQILSDAGSRFQMADPTTWPQQAALAAAGKWDELQALQDSLQAGKRT